MYTYIALLRGIAPMNPNMRNDKLRAVCEDLGFSHVKTVISSGNIIFSSSQKSATALAAQLEAAWPQKLGFTSTTIVRSLDDMKKLLQKDPFAGLTHTPTTSLNVTFLQQPSTAHFPVTDPNFTIAAAYDTEICSIINTTATKTPRFMLLAERTYGKKITTRSWNTVQRIIAAAETPAK